MVDGLLLVAAVREPHRAPVADVDGGIEDHAATRAQMRVKLRSSASPLREDFSGWNCAPMTVPRSAMETNGRRSRPRPTTSASSSGQRRVGVHVVEARGRAEALRQRGRPREGHLVPPDVRHLQARRAQRATVPESRPMPSTSSCSSERCTGAGTQADAQHGRAGGGLLADHLVEPELAQARHGGREGADAGHHEPVGGPQVARGRS